MKNCNNTIGNRTHNLLACSAVFQPVAPPYALNLHSVIPPKTLTSIKLFLPITESVEQKDYLNLWQCFWVCQHNQIPYILDTQTLLPVPKCSHRLTLPTFTIGLWEISWQLELRTHLFNFCRSNNLPLYSPRVFIHIQRLSIIIKLLLTQTACATHHCTDVSLSNIISPSPSLPPSLSALMLLLLWCIRPFKWSQRYKCSQMTCEIN